ncbi:MAG: LytTR family DNA-binding domain-containing protein [Prolixibacteraceae bacterium]|jgi:DNA-binding LytR/AlgR family response regulator|nr:LytTR family DNA-binding domain-containing protein [Prolixibacteraceae bacterium]
MENEIKALIIDDDNSARSILKHFLKVCKNVHLVGSKADTVSGLEIVSAEKPDVIFLDINMPHENGLDFARRLREKGSDIQIVFTTAYKKYAVSAFDIKPVDYLVKPFGVDEVFNVLSKVNKNIKKQEKQDNEGFWDSVVTDKIKFKTLSGYVFLFPNEICYVLTQKGNINLYLCDGSIIRILGLMNEIDTMLTSNNFIRINRSALLNSQYIYSINKKNRECTVKCLSIEEKFHLKNEILEIIDNNDIIKL